MTEVLQSSTSLKCLLYIAARGEAPIDDIAELFGLDALEVNDTLIKLEREYILTSRRIRHSFYYSINPTWYYSGELQSMLQKIISCMPYEEQQRLLPTKESPSFK